MYSMQQYSSQVYLTAHFAEHIRAVRVIYVQYMCIILYVSSYMYI